MYPNITAIRDTAPHTNIPPIRIKSASGGKQTRPNMQPDTVNMPTISPNFAKISLS